MGALATSGALAQSPALGPAIIVAAAFFIGSGMLLAGLFGVSFIVPWIGGLPLAAVVYSRRALARLGLFVLERLDATESSSIRRWTS